MLIYLVERPCVVETALPYFIDSLFRGCLVGARRIGTHRQHRTASHALLFRQRDVQSALYRRGDTSARPAWCCFENDTNPRRNSRLHLQSPLRLFARIFHSGSVFVSTPSAPRHRRRT